MLNLFKKDKNHNRTEYEAVWQILQLFYSSSLTELKNLSLNLKIRSLLFTYGVIDAYCQASNLNSEESNYFFKQMNHQINSIFNLSIISLLNSSIMKIVFNDSFLLDIVSNGGKSYRYFLSNDKQKGSMSLQCFTSLLGLWSNIDILDSERQIITILKR